MTQKNSARRNFLKTSLMTGVGLGAATLATPAIASGKQKLKMVMTWPKKLPGMGVSAVRLAKRINDATDGRINIKPYGAGELVPALESFDAVRNGTADVYHAAAYYWQGKSPAFAFFTTVPFGMTEPELEAWIRHGGGQELYDELYADYGLKPFVAGNSGVQMGGFFRKEINSVEDLKGLKMRMPGLGGSVMKKLGVSTVNLPGGEIYPALQSGTIDATEWVGPWQDLMMGFHKVAPYYYHPGFHEPGSAWETVFNKNVWDSFSKSDQMVIEACIGYETSISAGEFNANNTRSLDTLINKHKVKLRTFNEDIYQAFADATVETLEEVTAKDAMAKKVYKSYKDFYKQAARWTELSTGGYTSMRNKVWKF